MPRRREANREGEYQRGGVGRWADDKCRVGMLQSGGRGDRRNEHGVAGVVAGTRLVREVRREVLRPERSLIEARGALHQPLASGQVAGDIDVVHRVAGDSAVEGDRAPAEDAHVAHEQQSEQNGDGDPGSRSFQAGRRCQDEEDRGGQRTRSPKDAYGECQSVDNTHQPQQVRFRLIGKQVACSER